MIALSMATLGVQCTSRAVAMATLGVYCPVQIAIVPVRRAPDVGGYTVELDEMEVLEICSIIIASGVLDG